MDEQKPINPISHPGGSPEGPFNNSRPPQQPQPASPIVNPISNPISNPGGPTEPGEPFQAPPSWATPQQPAPPPAYPAPSPASPPSPPQYPQPASPDIRPPIQPAPPYQPPSLQPGTTPEPVSIPPAAAPTTPAAKPVKSRGKSLVRKKIIKIAAGVVGAVIVIALAFFIIGHLSNLKTETVKNGNFTYSFKFYKSAVATQTGGENTYKYSDTSIADPQPTNQRLVSSCSQLGAKWNQAFMIELNDTQRPVCTYVTSNVQAYDMIFPALNSNHLFLITTYNSPETAASDATLKTILESIKVSQ